MWYDLLIVGNDPAGTQIALMASRAGLAVAVVHDPATLAATTQQGVDALAELSDRIESRPPGTPRPTMAHCRGEYEKILRRERELAVRLLSRSGVEVMSGEWRWQSDRRVDVATEVGRLSIEADHVVVATGDQHRRPAWMNRSDLRAVVADELFDGGEWPHTAVVAGVDRVGLAAARLLAAVGVAVTLVDRRSGQVKLPAGQPWSDTYLGKWVVGLTTDERGDALVVLHDGSLVRTDLVVVALGTEARSVGPNFRRLGAKADDRGRLWCGSNFETTVRGLFAAGRIVATAETATGYEIAIAVLRSEFPDVAGKMMARARTAAAETVLPMTVPLAKKSAATVATPVSTMPTRVGTNTVVFKSDRDPGERRAAPSKPANRARAERAVPAGWRVVG